MKLQVIFGTGPVGLATARALVKQGFELRLVNRSGSLDRERLLAAPELESDRVEIVQADAMNRDEVLAAAHGASHIYHCLNPLYHQWAKILPVVKDHFIEAAIDENAVLIASENLYMYAQGVSSISLNTEINPPTQKGRIRQTLHEALIHAGRESGLRWTTVRASDYYGPGATDQSVVGTRYFLDPLYEGKKVLIMGNPDAAHSYTYVRDFGNALALAAHKQDALGQAWIVSQDETASTADLASRFMNAAGRKTRVRRISTGMLRFLGLFNPVVRELVEMMYQKEEPYVVDGSHFKKAFSFHPTDTETAVSETIVWYESVREAAKG